MIRGKWRDRRASSLIVETGVALVSMTRGLDFLSGNDSPAAVVGLAGNIIPLCGWGFMFISGSSLVLIAMLGRWGWLAIGAHILLSGVFVTTGIGVIAELGFGTDFRVWSALLIFGLVIHGGFILSIVTVISTHEGEIPPEEL